MIQVKISQKIVKFKISIKEKKKDCDRTPFRLDEQVIQNQQYVNIVK